VVFILDRCCYPFLGPHTKKRKKIKKNKNYRKKTKKIYSSERKTHGHLENSQRLVDGDQKYKDWNLTVYFLLMKALLEKKI